MMGGQDLIARSAKPRMLDDSRHLSSISGRWGQVFAGLANFFAPILAPIWTPFVDCQFYVIFTERTIHAQHD
jgi:hypothetical protein